MGAQIVIRAACAAAFAVLLGFACLGFGFARSAYLPITSGNGMVLFPFAYSNAHLTCRPLLVCDVTLGEHESILNVAVGDSVRWIVASANSGPGGSTPHVFVKPTEYGLTTNLVITTTRHTYYIDLTSGKGNGPSRIGFYYPDDEREARRNAMMLARLQAASAPGSTSPPQPTPTPIPPRLEFRYRMYGDASILPTLVYNDGSHIYLQYERLPPDLPVPYAATATGPDQIVNYRISGSTIVVDGLPVGIDLILNAGTGKHDRGEVRAYVRRA